MSSKTISLVTGGNQGIGYEVCKQIAERSPTNHVILCSRDLAKGETAASQIRESGVKGSISVVQLEVTSQESIDKAVQLVEKDYGTLDVLVNNAGVSTKNMPLVLALRQSLETNAIGPVAVTEAFLPLLRTSKQTRRIIFVSSELGSLNIVSDPQWPFYGLKVPAYSTSKSALNMIVVQYAKELAEDGFKVFSVCPGYLATNLSGDREGAKARGAGKPEDGGKFITDVCSGNRDVDAGKLIYVDGIRAW